MKVARHWAKEIDSAQNSDGRWYRLTGWGGSNSSLEQARENAHAQLLRWKNKLSAGGELGSYGYDSHQIREELIEEHADDNGEPVVAITLNRYGALVLNAPRLLIADVDLPQRSRPRPSLIQSMLSLFTGKFAHPPGRHPQEAEYLQHFEKWRGRYELKSRGAAVCELVQQYGDRPLNDAARRAIELHDRYVLGAGGTRLA